MRKIKWSSLFICIGCIWIAVALLNIEEYYKIVYYKPTSPKNGLVYLMGRIIDLYIGRTGVILFFILLALIFLCSFCKKNMNSIYRRYRDYKESGDWKCLFRPSNM